MADPYDRPARLWDLFNKELGRVEPIIAQERYTICQACPRLNALAQCDECHCFMPSKVKLPNAFCPLDKWGIVRVMQNEPIKVAVVIDGEVVDVLHADDRVTSYLLSQPKFVGFPMDAEVNIGDRVEEDSDGR